MSTTEFSAPEAAARQAGPDRSEKLRPTGGRRSGSAGEPDLDWRRSAACVERDLNTFFPISSVGAAAQQQILEAKHICGGCAVRRECLEWALEVGPEFGIFGGHTEEERRALRSRDGAATRWRTSPGVGGHRSEEAVVEALEPR